MRLLATLLLATTAFAVPPPCELSVRLLRTSDSPHGVEAVIEGPEADHYLVVATADGAPPIVRTAPSLDLSNFLFEMPSVTKPSPFRVTAVATYGSGAEAVSCKAEASIVNEPDARLSGVAGRVIVPAAGSANGAFGGRFRTSLRLTGFGTGRIYFRRQGTFFGDGRDPFLAYDLGGQPIDGPHRTVYFDDVVAAIGASGLGNLDVVPDLYTPEVNPPGRYAPEVEARVFNDSPIGRFGSPVEVIGADDLFVPSLDIPIPPETLASARINVGIRTFGEPVPVSVDSFSHLGGLLRLAEFELPANTFRQIPLETLMGRAPDALDAEIHLYFAGRAVAAYYSITENTTNDPAVVVNAVRETESGEISSPVIPVRQ